MYLMDSLVQCARVLQKEGLFASGIVNAYTDLAHRLWTAPRFLLDDAATRTFVELTLGRPKVLREAMHHLRVPYRRMWVEWPDAARQQLRDRFEDKEPMKFAELRPMPGRVGFLIEADEIGRRGRATWAWTTPPNDDIPSIGCIEARYDLDRTFPLSEERRSGLYGGNLAQLWNENEVQQEAFFDIWRTGTHVPSSWTRDYIASSAGVGRDPALALSLAYADVVGEYISIWSILLLLTASRPIVRLDPVDRGRLNKVRKKRGATPLLDHTHVCLDLSQQTVRPVIRGALGRARKSPRIHMVSSYLARRGDKHWIVSPYFRGVGEEIHRRVHVRG